MLNKFFQSFHNPKKSDEDTFQVDLYNLIYEVIIADHEISPEEIDLSAELVEYYFQIPKDINKQEFLKLTDKQHFNTDLSQFTHALRYLCPMNKEWI